MTRKHPWFGAKRYGYGLSPKGWRGALACGVFLAVVTGFVVHAPGWLAAHRLSPAWTAAGVAVIVVGFLGVVARTSDGRPWRWRWGRD